MLYSTIQHIVKKKMHACHKFFKWIALANLIFETLVRIRPQSGKPNPIPRLQQFPASFIYNEGLTVNDCARVRRGYQSRHAIEAQVRSSPPEAVSIKTENFMLELYSTL